jgi:hypothetical protein
MPRSFENISSGLPSTFGSGCVGPKTGFAAVPRPDDQAGFVAGQQIERAITIDVERRRRDDVAEMHRRLRRRAHRQPAAEREARRRA